MAHRGKGLSRRRHRLSTIGANRPNQMAVGKNHKGPPRSGWKGTSSYCEDIKGGLQSTRGKISTTGAGAGEQVENRTVLAGGMMAPEYTAPKPGAIIV